MSIFTILLIAVSLAMDAFAVSIAVGISLHKVRPYHALTIALSFGVFQALMPLIGWLGGTTIKGIIAPVDHWVAFGLLFFIGVRMIYESTKSQPSRTALTRLQVGTVLILSVATSIDALAVGISLSLLDVAILLPIAIIGGVTLVLSFAGVYIGRYLGTLFERVVHIVGGLILIAIGIRILIEHL